MDILFGGAFCGLLCRLENAIALTRNIYLAQFINANRCQLDGAGGNQAQTVRETKPKINQIRMQKYFVTKLLISSVNLDAPSMSDNAWSYLSFFFFGWLPIWPGRLTHPTPVHHTQPHIQNRFSTKKKCSIWSNPINAHVQLDLIDLYIAQTGERAVVGHGHILWTVEFELKLNNKWIAMARAINNVQVRRGDDDNVDWNENKHNIQNGTGEMATCNADINNWFVKRFSMNVINLHAQINEEPHRSCARCALYRLLPHLQ